MHERLEHVFLIVLNIDLTVLIRADMGCWLANIDAPFDDKLTRRLVA